MDFLKHHGTSEYGTEWGKVSGFGCKAHSQMTGSEERGLGVAAASQMFPSSF